MSNNKNDVRELETKKRQVHLTINANKIEIDKTCFQKTEEEKSILKSLKKSLKQDK